MVNDAPSGGQRRPWAPHSPAPFAGRHDSRTALATSAEAVLGLPPRDRAQIRANGATILGTRGAPLLEPTSESVALAIVSPANCHVIVV